MKSFASISVVSAGFKAVPPPSFVIPAKAGAQAQHRIHICPPARARRIMVMRGKLATQKMSWTVLWARPNAKELVS